MIVDWMRQLYNFFSEVIGNDNIFYPRFKIQDMNFEHDSLKMILMNNVHQKVKPLTCYNHKLATLSLVWQAANKHWKAVKQDGLLTNY